MVGANQKVPELGVGWYRKGRILRQLGINPFDQEIPNGFRAVSWELKVMVILSAQ